MRTQKLGTSGSFILRQKSVYHSVKLFPVRRHAIKFHCEFTRKLFASRSNSLDVAHPLVKPYCCLIARSSSSLLLLLLLPLTTRECIRDTSNEAMKHRRPGCALNFYRNVNSRCTWLPSAFLSEVTGETDADQYCTRAPTHARSLHSLRATFDALEVRCIALLSCIFAPSVESKVHSQCLSVIGQDRVRRITKMERSPARHTARSSFGLHYADWILSAPHFSAL